jgi:hypothetical protein
VLVVLGNNLVLVRSIDDCKLGLYVIPARTSERHKGTCCLQLPLLLLLLHSKSVATHACLGSVKWVQVVLLALLLIVGL